MKHSNRIPKNYPKILNQRIWKCGYKTLGTSIIKSPMTHPCYKWIYGLYVIFLMLDFGVASLWNKLKTYLWFYIWRSLHWILTFGEVGEIWGGFSLPLLANLKLIMDIKTMNIWKIYSIDVYTDNYFPFFFKDLFRLLLNYFLLLGCVDISDTIGWFSMSP